MRMYKCDRCGKLVKQGSMKWVSRPYRGIYRIGRKAHVCCECRDSFRKWFYEAKLQQGGNSEE